MQRGKAPKLLIKLTICFMLYAFGVITHKFQLQPYTIVKEGYNNFFKINYKNINTDLVENYKKKYPNYILQPRLVKYVEKDTIWHDRYYYNHLNEDKIKDLYLLKIEKHRNKKIVIKLKEKIVVFRVLCELNNNTDYKTWKNLDYNLLIISDTCVHSQFVFKEYPPGNHIISPGGKISSDPIFFGQLKSIQDIEIIF